MTKESERYATYIKMTLDNYKRQSICINQIDEYDSETADRLRNDSLRAFKANSERIIYYHSEAKKDYALENTRGFHEGYSVGYREGFFVGNTTGCCKGYARGLQDGYERGIKDRTEDLMSLITVCEVLSVALIFAIAYIIIDKHGPSIRRGIHHCCESISDGIDNVSQRIHDIGSRIRTGTARHELPSSELSYATESSGYGTENSMSQTQPLRGKFWARRVRFAREERFYF